MVDVWDTVHLSKDIRVIINNETHLLIPKGTEGTVHEIVEGRHIFVSFKVGPVIIDQMLVEDDLE